MGDLYDVARQVTDEVMGAGTYAKINKGNPDPRVQAAIRRGETAVERDTQKRERAKKKTP